MDVLTLWETVGALIWQTQCSLNKCHVWIVTAHRSLHPDNHRYSFSMILLHSLRHNTNPLPSFFEVDYTLAIPHVLLLLLQNEQLWIILLVCMQLKLYWDNGTRKDQLSHCYKTGKKWDLFCVNMDQIMQFWQAETTTIYIGPWLFNITSYFQRTVLPKMVLKIDQTLKRNLLISKYTFLRLI